MDNVNVEMSRPAPELRIVALTAGACVERDQHVPMVKSAKMQRACDEASLRSV